MKSFIPSRSWTVQLGEPILHYASFWFPIVCFEQLLTSTGATEHVIIAPRFVMTFSAACHSVPQQPVPAAACFRLDLFAEIPGCLLAASPSTVGSVAPAGYSAAIDSSFEQAPPSELFTSSQTIPEGVCTYLRF